MNRTFVSHLLITIHFKYIIFNYYFEHNKIPDTYLVHDEKLNPNNNLVVAQIKKKESNTIIDL